MPHAGFINSNSQAFRRRRASARCRSRCRHYRRRDDVAELSRPSNSIVASPSDHAAERAYASTTIFGNVNANPRLTPMPMCREYGIYRLRGAAADGRDALALLLLTGRRCNRHGVATLFNIDEAGFQRKSSPYCQQEVADKLGVSGRSLLSIFSSPRRRPR